MNDTATPRQAARLLIVDPDRRAVLLFQYDDAGQRWWATPGGGLEGDETFEEAAAREAAEELALRTPALVPLWEQTVEFSFRGVRLLQTERYFLIRLSADEISLTRATQEVHEREGIVAARWWSLEEMDAASERIFPVDLPSRLRELTNPRR